MNKKDIKSSSYRVFNTVMGNANIDIIFDVNPTTSKIHELAPIHNHCFYEIHCVLKGSCKVVTNKGTYTLKAGEFILIGARVYHYIQIDKNINCITKDIRFYPSLDSKKDTSVMTEFLDSLKEIHLFIGNDLYGLVSHISMIEKEYINQKTSYEQCINLNFSLVMILLERCIEDRKNETVFKDKAKEASSCNNSTLIDYAEIIARIEDFFNYSFGTKLSISDLARKTNLSTRHLSRIVNQLYNCSFKQKIIETRIEKSKYLLQKTTYPIQRICELAGYNSISSFSLLFKKYTDVSPSEYRKQYYLFK